MLDDSLEYFLYVTVLNGGEEEIGRASINLKGLSTIEEQWKDDWYQLTNRGIPAGEIRLRLRFLSDKQPVPTEDLAPSVGLDLSSSSENEESSPESPVMARSERSETTEATILHHHETRTSARRFDAPAREQSSDPRERLREWTRELEGGAQQANLQQMPTSPTLLEYTALVPPHHTFEGQADAGPSRQPKTGSHSWKPLWIVLTKSRISEDQNQYYFWIEVEFDDGQYWELSRSSEEFREFHLALLREFPNEAAIQDSPPVIPTAFEYIHSSISGEMNYELELFLKNLLKQPAHISESYILRNFLSPAKGADHQIHPGNKEQDGHDADKESSEVFASISAYELDATVRKVKGIGMVNKLLQLICVGEGLPKYGVKAELQQKIIDSEFVLPLVPSPVLASN